MTRSIGSHELEGAAVRAGSIRKLASQLGIEFPLVLKWYHGKQKPAYAGRKKIFEVIGTSLDAWDKPYIERPTKQKKDAA